MPSLQEAVTLYLQQPRAPITNRNYRRVLNRFARAVGPDRDITLVSSADIGDYITRRPNLKPSTAREYLQVIRTFFNYEVRIGQLACSPAQHVSIPRVPRSPANRAVPPDELAAMIDAVRHHPRNYAMLLFLADTGCRVGGLISLTVDNLDLDHHAALLLEKGNRWHRVYYGGDTAAALKRWLARRPAKVPYVFTSRRGRLSAGGVASIVARAAQLAGCSRSWRPHSIRHAVGHALAARGVPVTVTARKLGHANPSITMGFYYPDGEDLVRAVSAKHALAATKPDGESARSKRKILRFEDFA